MTAWVRERKELPRYARQHSMNQRVLKRDAELQRKFEAKVKRERKEWSQTPRSS